VTRRVQSYRQSCPVGPGGALHHGPGIPAASGANHTRTPPTISISDIDKACGLPASSIYWHFGSKEGVLAAVMERGAERYFAAIPVEADFDRQLAAVTELREQHPEFLRLFLLLSLERNHEPAVVEVIRRVRDRAIAGFRDAVAKLMPADVPAWKARRVVAELAAVATALSDGIFLAEHLEPGATDIGRIYLRLHQTVTALTPLLLEEKWAQEP
jgi:AcrR family transcriptional regulator